MRSLLMRQKVLIAIVAAFAGIFGAVFFLMDRSPVSEVEDVAVQSEDRISNQNDGDLMPPFKYKRIDGEGELNSLEYKGDVLVLAFFATWCPPCRLEAPELVKLQKKYQEKGFSVIGLSMDIGKPELVQSFVKEFSVNYPVVIADQELVAKYGGVYTIPTSFLVDRAGNVVMMYTGAVSYDTLAKAVETLL